MRNVIAGLFISLDGVVEAPNLWQFDVWDADMEAAMQSYLDRLDTALMGRVTYQEWSSYWPTSTDEPYATFINNVPKYVVSTTLDRVGWQNSTLVKGNLREAVSQLKQQPGKDIGVQGSPTLIRSLLEADLLDELMLTYHPVVVGKGKRLFQDASELKRLKLVDSKTSGTGVAILIYQPLR